MNCDERGRLLGLYNKATLTLARTIEDLLQSTGVGSSGVYDIRRRAAKKARAGFEIARLAYEDYVREPGCETSNLIGTYAGQLSSVMPKELHQPLPITPVRGEPAFPS